MPSDTREWLAKVTILPSELVKKKTSTPDSDLADYAKVLQNYMSTVEGELRRTKRGEAHQRSQQAGPSHPGNDRSRDFAARESRTDYGNLGLAKNNPGMLRHVESQDETRSHGRDES